MGHQPGTEFEGNEYFQHPRALLILTVAQLSHTVKLQFSKVFQKGLWSMEEHERDGVKIEREVN